VAVVVTDLLVAVKLNTTVPCNHGLLHESVPLFTGVESNEGAHTTLTVLQQWSYYVAIPNVLDRELELDFVVYRCLLAMWEAKVI
jgi:hypothetical protein